MRNATTVRSCQFAIFQFARATGFDERGAVQDAIVRQSNPQTLFGAWRGIAHRGGDLRDRKQIVQSIQELTVTEAGDDPQLPLCTWQRDARLALVKPTRHGAFALSAWP